ncbi:YfjI family protein [Deinococcus alpinitundrae]|uniref:YfjI family protein n=1 Tax=Deinococcus alpinitundrae TaxID=468913 RepID=UPI00137A7278|nr:YfjI family protein [Deinococcus alpinitundrae]
MKLNDLRKNGTGQPNPTPEQPLTDLNPPDWLQALYGDAAAQGWIEYRLIRPGGKIEKHWARIDGPDTKNLEDVRRWVAQGWNVYYGVSLRREEGVSGDDGVYPTHLLWQDFDLKDAAGYMPEGQDVKQMTPEALKEAKARLYVELMRRCEALGILPVAVVNTGHGLQVLWKRTASNTQETEALNLMLCNLFKDLGADRKTRNPERIFRLPSSKNLKNPERPLLVEIWHLNPLQIVDDAILKALKPMSVAKRSTPSVRSDSVWTPPTEGNVIQAFNTRNPIGEVLERYGYRREDAKTYTRPGDDASGRDVKLLVNERGVLCSYHHSSNDPLDGGNGDGHLREPFDLYAEFEHGGDMKAAVKMAAGLGMSMLPDLSVGSRRVEAVPGVELEWKLRQDLPPKLPPVPTMPPEMLPEALRAWLVNASMLACLPLELFAVLAVAALSGLLGRSVKISPEQGWNVVPNLWAAIVGRPGSMKSMILDTALEPLQRLERLAAEDHQAQLLDVEIEREALQAEAATLKKQAVKSGRLDREALRDLKEREKVNVAVAKRYVTQNVTYEKLGELIQENPRGLAFTRDELGSWINDLTREERAEALGFFLTSWNGEGAYAFERIGRGTVRADNPCIAVIGGIQPGPLMSFMARSRAGSAGDSGLLQRFQLIVWPDSLGEWVRHGGQVFKADRERAFAVFEALDALHRHGSGGPPVLPFSDDAQPIWEEWRDALENRLRGGEMEHAPAFESHVSKYRSLAPSLALVFHLVELTVPGTDPTTLPPVSANALELALNWVEFLELHARKVYALELGTSNAPAYALAEKIKAKAVRDGDRLRDLRRKDWAILTDGLLDRAVEQLTELGWVQVEETETGGRTAEVLRLHPDLIGVEA